MSLLLIPAAQADNVSILYGWNGTNFAPVTLTSTGAIMTDINMSESIGLNPKTNNTYDLGATNNMWANLYARAVRGQSLLSIYAGDTEAMTLLGSGAVGVGTASPAAKLEVSGTNAVNNISLNVNNTLYVNNSGGGNVGIGTASPTGKLDVGATYSSSGTLQVHPGGTGDVSIALQRGTSTANSDWRILNTGGNLQFASGYDATTNGAFRTATMTLTYDTARVGIGTTSPSAGLQINTSNPTFRTNGSVFIDGNVGIGTTGPMVKLGVSSDVTATNFSTTIARFAGVTYGAGRFYGIGFDYDPSHTNQPVALGYIPTNGGGYTEGALVFATRSGTTDAAPSERMRIDENGNVGIGDTSPDEKLHVRTDAAYTASTSLFGGGGNVLSQGAEPAFALSQDLGSAGTQTGSETSVGGMTFVYVSASDYNNLRIGTQTNNKVIFRTNNVDRMTIDNVGDVGIGTTNPSNARLRIENPLSSSKHALGINQANNAEWAIYIWGTGANAIRIDDPIDNNCYETGAGGVCSLNDYAEMMEFSELPNDSQLVVIDTEHPGLLKVSTKPYDRLVAGIASQDPAMIIGSYGITIKGWDKNLTAKIKSDGTKYYAYPLAISGRKLISVTDENRAVMPGDLLVSSSERGKAMRCDNYEKCRGAIIGKAMTQASNGIVLALITIQ